MSRWYEQDFGGGIVETGLRTTPQWLMPSPQRQRPHTLPSHPFLYLDPPPVCMQTSAMAASPHPYRSPAMVATLAPLVASSSPHHVLGSRHQSAPCIHSRHSPSIGGNSTLQQRVEVDGFYINFDLSDFHIIDSHTEEAICLVDRIGF